MRRRNWIFAIILCIGMLPAMALAARAEPDDIPDDEIPETTTTTRSRSTYDWEAETDEHGVTVYPPPPNDDDNVTSGPTTTTKKTARTPPPFVVNPAHPEDTDTREPGYRPLPDFYVRVTDQYGNEITRPAPETSIKEASDVAHLMMQTSAQEEETGSFTEILEEAQQPAISWPVAAGAGAALLAALVGVIVMLARGRRGGEDDYIYEDAQQ